jgi:ribosomal protein S18 acetylase RimI-like enzyme
MNLDSLLLRPAEPNLEEGLAYGHYLDDLAPGFRYTLGRHAAETIAEAYLRPGHDLSYEHVTFAELDGLIVGAAAGYTTEQHRHSVGGGLAQAIHARSRPRHLRSAAIAKWLRYFGPESDAEFYVWLLAVSEEYRGHGVGSLLMDHLEERAREAGSSHFSLDADAKNHRARSFYERRGMSVASGWPRLPLVPWMVVRMSKAL